MRRNNSFTRLFVSALFFFSLHVANAQGSAEDNNEQQGTIDDIPAKPIRLPALQDINGSPFLTPDYVLGSVQLTNDKVVTSVPIKFNIFSNAVMIQKDGSDLMLESFHMVSYDQQENNGNIKHFHFKPGYPEIDNHTDKSIYQVLAFGSKVHLIKFLSQKVEDVNSLGEYSRRDIVTTEQLYLYLPGGEIKKIKIGKQSFLDAAPSLAPKIEEITTAKKLKLKSESDMIALVEELNKS
jgi:hypothetical protein